MSVNTQEITTERRKGVELSAVIENASAGEWIKEPRLPLTAMEGDEDGGDNADDERGKDGKECL